MEGQEGQNSVSLKMGRYFNTIWASKMAQQVNVLDVQVCGPKFNPQNPNKSQMSWLQHVISALSQRHGKKLQSSIGSKNNESLPSKHGGRREAAPQQLPSDLHTSQESSSTNLPSYFFERLSS